MQDPGQPDSTELLRTLIRNACVNDGDVASGQKGRNVDALEAYFAGSGLWCERYSPAPGRANLITRIEQGRVVCGLCGSRMQIRYRLRHRQVERAQYEADRARHRYMQVDPANRLVADSLEACIRGGRAEPPGRSGPGGVGNFQKGLYVSFALSNSQWQKSVLAMNGSVYL